MYATTLCSGHGNEFITIEYTIHWYLWVVRYYFCTVILGQPLGKCKILSEFRTFWQPKMENPTFTTRWRYFNNPKRISRTGTTTRMSHFQSRHFKSKLSVAGSTFQRKLVLLYKIAAKCLRAVSQKAQNLDD